MILVNGEENALAHGRAWIEAETGVVHKTELVVGDADSDIRVVTWYRLDPRLSMWVPARMTEAMTIRSACRTSSNARRRTRTSAVSKLARG